MINRKSHQFDPWYSDINFLHQIRQYITTLWIFLGDLSVVAALGDGILAAKGALADNLADMNIEYKGVSFATGKAV